MFTRMFSLSAASIVLCTFTGFAAAQPPSADQQDVWKSNNSNGRCCSEDSSWIDTLSMQT